MKRVRCEKSATQKMCTTQVRGSRKIAKHEEIALCECTARKLRTEPLPDGQQHVPLCQERLCELCLRLLLGRVPNGQAEPDFVDEIGNVVNQVQRAVRDGTHQVAEEVAQRVDGPANCDNETHGAERTLHSFRRSLACNSAGLSHEDLEQNEAPSGHAHRESHPWVDDKCLTEVAEEKHDHSANEQAEEHAGTKVWLDGLQDEVELNHLQRDCQAPVDVAIHDGAHVDGHPELTHVEVMHSCDQSHQSSDVHRSLPVVRDGRRFHQEENGRGNHGHGNDPERDRHMVSWVKKPVEVLWDGDCGCRSKFTRHGVCCESC